MTYLHSHTIESRSKWYSDPIYFSIYTIREEMKRFIDPQQVKKMDVSQRRVTTLGFKPLYVPEIIQFDQKLSTQQITILTIASKEEEKGCPSTLSAKLMGKCLWTSLVELTLCQVPYLGDHLGKHQLKQLRLIRVYNVFHMWRAMADYQRIFGGLPKKRYMVVILYDKTSLRQQIKIAAASSPLGYALTPLPSAFLTYGKREVAFTTHIVQFQLFVGGLGLQGVIGRVMCEPMIQKS